MDWFNIATNDWLIYRDKDRLKNYVLKGKITEDEYKSIVGE